MILENKYDGGGVTLGIKNIFKLAEFLMEKHLMNILENQVAFKGYFSKDR